MTRALGFALITVLLGAGSTRTLQRHAGHKLALIVAIGCVAV